jgi:aspartate/methionine/tyrosine aminotransferase
LNSLSKTFNMAGWRVGMVLGNSKLIDAVLKVKSNMDSGMFYGIQKGAIEALKLGKDWFEQQSAGAGAGRPQRGRAGCSGRSHGIGRWRGWWWSIRLL